MVTRNRSGQYSLDLISIPYHHLPLTNACCYLHRILAWPSLILGLSAWINQHPLRTKETGTPPISNLMSVRPVPSCLACGAKLLVYSLAFLAFVASYLPLVLKTASATPLRQVPLN